MSVIKLPSSTFFAVEFKKSQYLAPPGSSFESEIHNFRGVDFKVKIFISTNSNALSAYLFADCDETIDLNLYLKNWFGPDHHLTNKYYNPEMGHKIGQINVVDQSELAIKSDFIQNNKIRFIVEIPSDVNSLLMERETSKKSKSSWHDEIPSMLFNDMYSDVALIVGEARIPAHKFVLGLTSPMFRVTFESSPETKNEISISDFSEEVVRSFLKCIYDPSTTETQLYLHGDQLLHISERCKVQNLSAAAAKHLIKHITVQNALNILKIAHKYDKQDMKSATMTFMASHASQFLKISVLHDELGSGGYSDLVSELLSFLYQNYSFEPKSKK